MGGGFELTVSDKRRCKSTLALTRTTRNARNASRVGNCLVQRLEIVRDPLCPRSQRTQVRVTRRPSACRQRAAKIALAHGYQLLRAERRVYNI